MTTTAFQQWVTPSDNYIPDLIILTYTNESSRITVNSSAQPWSNDSETPSKDSSPWWKSHYPSGYTWPHIIVASVLLTITIVMIIIGNFLVIWAIMHDRTLKTTQNMFIASLAFADFFIGLIILPFSLTNELMGYWMFGVVWCELYKAIDVLLCTASIMSLCLISLDRYWSISRAVHYARQRTRKRAAIMIFTVWFISAVVSIPPLIGWKQPPRESEWPLCTLSKDVGYVVYSALGSFFIPSFIMLFVYFKIYQAAKQRARKSVVNAPVSASGVKAERKHSTESSMTEHRGNKNGSLDNLEDMPTMDESAFPGNGTEETACDSFPATSDDESNFQMKRPAENRLLALREEECSKLLVTDSESNDAPGRILSALDKGTLGFEALPKSDTDSSDHIHKVTPATSKPAATVPASDDHNGLQEDTTGGPLRRFKIVELRANGTSSVTHETKKGAPKSTLFGAIRRHFFRARKTNRRRKPARSGDPAKNTDFHSAERQKRKLAKARERRATFVLGVVMAALVLCWLPFFVIYLVEAFCAGCIPEMVFTIFFLIGYCNSALNPIIYTVFNRDFKKAFQKILFGKRRGGRR